MFHRLAQFDTASKARGGACSTPEARLPSSASGAHLAEPALTSQSPFPTWVFKSRETREANPLIMTDIDLILILNGTAPAEGVWLVAWWTRSVMADFDAARVHELTTCCTCATAGPRGLPASYLPNTAMVGQAYYRPGNRSIQSLQA